MSAPLLPVPDLLLIGVEDANMPNRERITLRPVDTLNLSRFGIMVAIRDDKGTYHPVSNYVFWFPSVEVRTPSWIHVYTCAGVAQPNSLKPDGRVVHEFYWDHPRTLFSSHQIAPVLFSIGAATFGHLRGEPEIHPVQEDVRKLFASNAKMFKEWASLTYPDEDREFGKK